MRAHRISTLSGYGPAVLGVVVVAVGVWWGDEMNNLTEAEKRCLRRSFEICRGMPDFPERIQASFRISRHATIESLNSKGYLRWSAHRGSCYTFTQKARDFVGAPPAHEGE